METRLCLFHETYFCEIHQSIWRRQGRLRHQHNSSMYHYCNYPHTLAEQRLLPHFRIDRLRPSTHRLLISRSIYFVWVAPCNGSFGLSKIQTGVWNYSIRCPCRDANSSQDAAQNEEFVNGERLGCWGHKTILTSLLWGPQTSHSRNIRFRTVYPLNRNSWCGFESVKPSNTFSKIFLTMIFSCK